MVGARRRGILGVTREDTMTRSSEDQARVLIAGGGVAGLEAAFALQKLAGDRVDVEVLAPEGEFVYRPLAVLEPFRVGDVARFPLHTIVEAAGGRLRHGRLRAVDADRKAVATGEWEALDFDFLLLALGAVQAEGVPGALTFGGPQDGPALNRLLRRVREGHARRIAFVLPEAAGWPLPLYELALLTRAHATAYGVRGVEILLVTPEEEPLALFGTPASDALRDLLALQEIELETGVRSLAFDRGRLAVEPGGALEVDAAVSLPRLEGPRITGVPHDDDRFVPVDDFGRAEGLDDVYAAGDIVQFPIKQGGLAAQQADAAASAIAAAAGADVQPVPFAPVLRGLLLTGGPPRFLRSEGGGAEATVGVDALWWPPAKIVGRYLAPYLAARAGIREPSTWTPDVGAVPVDVELELGPTGAWPAV
jgi:sulfide:quinone oxidoreductase